MSTVFIPLAQVFHGPLLSLYRSYSTVHHYTVGCSTSELPLISVRSVQVNRPIEFITATLRSLILFSNSFIMLQLHLNTTLVESTQIISSYTSTSNNRYDGFLIIFWIGHIQYRIPIVPMVNSFQRCLHSCMFLVFIYLRDLIVNGRM